MSPDQLTLFLTLTFFVSLSPGPVMLACMAYGARVGTLRAFLMMAGACAGNLALIALSALGAGLLLRQHPWLFQALQGFGACWLILLGLQMARKPPMPLDMPGQVSWISGRALWSRGLIIALSNPKGLIYFGAFFPQFLQPQQPLLPQYAVLLPLFLLVDVAMMLVYAWGGSAMMQWIKNPRHQRGFNRFTGGLLIAAGLWMLLGQTGL